MTADQQKKLGQLVAELCQANMSLWKEEDIARIGTDAEIVKAKRAVDKYNQTRNDLIEKIDDYVLKIANKGN